MLESLPCRQKIYSPGRYLFDVLDDLVKDQVVRQATEHQFGNQDYLVRQGEKTSGIHIIKSGTVETLHEPCPGKELILASWTVGDFIGGPYLLGDHEHIWSSRALGRVTTLHLDKDALRWLASESTAFGIALIECVGFKGERYSKFAQVMATHTTTERLALLISELAQNAKRTGDGRLRVGLIKQSKLSHMIGATRQSVANALQKLEDCGAIAIEATSIVITNPDALAAFTKSGTE